jgi:import inner membrane translocase subunit TIM54
MIFWAITGSIAGGVVYDKWQTKRMREKWCNVVSHLADEPLDSKNMPRRLTIYLAAPPGDGLRSAREHFHAYIKPVLVAAAMDWDVVEGRKEGDVRHKTAEKIRRRRRRNGEGSPLSPEEAEKEAASAESVRAKAHVTDYPGVAGDIIIGRHTWIEYLRGLHEGYLGPVDEPKPVELAAPEADQASQHHPGNSSVGDAAVSAATKIIKPAESPVTSLQTVVDDASSPSPDSSSTESTVDPAAQTDEEKKKAEEEKKKEEEKPQRRFPPSYILPEDYHTASLSPSTPEIIGPSMGIRFPHLLGIRNTPFRLYRFFTRRHLADDVGRQVATAILASHRPYNTSVAAADPNSNAIDAAAETVVPEQKTVLEFEERDWWKTVRKAREEHEESVWIDPLVTDDRVLARMRKFEMSAEDEERAKRFALGLEKPKMYDYDEEKKE